MDGYQTVSYTHLDVYKRQQEGMAHPRAIDEDLFNAQQARRVLDRLVGYKLSPFLWRKVRRGLSADRKSTRLNSSH